MFGAAQFTNVNEASSESANPIQFNLESTFRLTRALCIHALLKILLRLP